MPSIRPVQPEDAPAVLALLHAAHAENLANGFNFTAADIPAGLLAPRLDPAAFFVATREGRLVGSIEVKPDDLGRWSFHLLAVAPEAAGQGVGRSLVAFAEAHARQHGGHSLGLDTPENHPWLPAFYASLGYAVEGHARWEGKLYRSVLMRKALAPV